MTHRIIWLLNFFWNTNVHAFILRKCSFFFFLTLIREMRHMDTLYLQCISLVVLYKSCETKNIRIIHRRISQSTRKNINLPMVCSHTASSIDRVSEDALSFLAISFIVLPIFVDHLEHLQHSSYSEWFFYETPFNSLFFNISFVYYSLCLHLCFSCFIPFLIFVRTYILLVKTLISFYLHRLSLSLNSFLSWISSLLSLNIFSFFHLPQTLQPIFSLSNTFPITPPLGHLKYWLSFIS